MKIDWKDLKLRKRMQIWLLLLIFSGLLIAAFFGWYKPKDTHQETIVFSYGNNYMADLYNVAIYAKDRSPYTSEIHGPEEKAYLPLSYLVCYPISKFLNMRDKFEPYRNYTEGAACVQNLPSIAIVVGVYAVLLMVTLVALAVYQMIQERAVYKLAITLMVLLSGGMIFSYERGNIILLAVAGMLFFVYTYDSDKKVLRELGYLALAFAAALKGYPALLGLLLVYRHEWKEAIRLLIYGLVFSFAPFLLLQGGFSNIPLWYSHVKSNSAVYEFIASPKIGLYYFAAYGKELTRDMQVNLIATWKPVVLVASVIGILSAYFQEKKWLQLGTIICIISIIPNNSGLYCILYMLPVLILYLNEEKPRIWDILYVVVFAIFLNPYQILAKSTGEVINLRMINIALLCFFGACILENLVSLVRLIRSKRLVAYIKNPRKRDEVYAEVCAEVQ